MPEQITDHRRAVAERNVEAILDAAEGILARHQPATISTVAEEAGVSRVTVYAHFSDRKQLLAAVVERAVGRWIQATERIDTTRGPADEALRRVLEAGWQEISRSSGIAAAAAAELDPSAMRASHDMGQRVIRRLVARGRKEKAFRTDVPAHWLVSAFFALIHAAHAEVSDGRLKPKTARDALLKSVPDLFRG
ncbi:MAG: TetR/AcrR family transcriptional regulator [Actinomycetota bacterium]|nr:TetR/AcrR family transcriptional regulator [Actinomycetota bacterium]